MRGEIIRINAGLPSQSGQKNNSGFNTKHGQFYLTTTILTTQCWEAEEEGKEKSCQDSVLLTPTIVEGYFLHCIQ